MINFTGTFTGSDGTNQVKFTIEGELTEDKVIDALEEEGYEINNSFYTNGQIFLVSSNRIDVEWDNGDSLSVFGTEVSNFGD